MRILPLPKYVPTLFGLIRNFVAHEAINPFYASFKITSRCHFGCPFCNMRKEKIPDLSTERIQRILDNLSNSSVLLVSFEGGEPLLRDDIEILLRYAKGCKFYLLFTTSAANIFDYPIKKYSQYIDFLHISIDEGHNNLAMFSLLPELVKLPTHVSVQTVVTSETIDALDWKVKQCWEVGANIVIIPASPMEEAVHCFPDIDRLRDKMQSLRKRYPRTIHTPQGYFAAYKNHSCSTASLIIAPDGFLYYPCHILQEKTIDLGECSLSQWLKTNEARVCRKKMDSCTRNCGWYQYYSIHSYLSPLTFLSSLKPLLKKNSRIVK